MRCVVTGKLTSNHSLANKLCNTDDITIQFLTANPSDLPNSFIFFISLVYCRFSTLIMTNFLSIPDSVPL